MSIFLIAVILVSGQGCETTESGGEGVFIGGKQGLLAEFVDDRVQEGRGAEYVFAGQTEVDIPEVLHIDQVDTEYVRDNKHRMQDDWGGKASHLMVAHSEGLPVPSGFVIPTQAGRNKDEKYFETINMDSEIEDLEKEWSEKYSRITGKDTGFVFNPTPAQIEDGAIPLLVAVKKTGCL